MPNPEFQLGFFINGQQKERLYLSRPEIRENRELGICAVNNRWGDEFLASDLERRIKEATGVDVFPSGFKTIFRSSPDLTDAEAEEQEIRTVVESTKLLLKVNGWEPESVEALSLGCGTPPVEDYGRLLADEVGLVNADVLNTYAACNSSGRALQRVLSADGAYNGRRVLVAGVEGMTRMARNLDDRVADPSSLAVFSNGASVMSLVPGQSLRYINGSFMSERDTRNLLGVPTYSVDPAGPLIQKEGNTEKIDLTVPQNGRLIDMNGKGTAIMFAKFGRALGTGVMTEYDNLVAGGVIEPRDINTVVAHHPSKPVGDLLRSTLEKAGLSFTNWPWVVTEGNSSASTSQFAFTRMMERFTPGERFLYLSFGAGMSGTGMVLEAGNVRQ